MSRLFVAVWPPDDVVAELMTLPRKDRRGVRFVPPANWHVTLRFLGEAPIDEAVVTLDGDPFPAARARLGPAVDVLAERALVVPVGGLDDLAAEVRRRTLGVGSPSRERFVGHLTLARVKHYGVMPPALGHLVSTEFEVDEVTLVRSRLDPDGARYEVLERWPCTARAGGG